MSESSSCFSFGNTQTRIYLEEQSRFGLSRKTLKFTDKNHHITPFRAVKSTTTYQPQQGAAAGAMISSDDLHINKLSVPASMALKQQQRRITHVPRNRELGGRHGSKVSLEDMDTVYQAIAMVDDEADPFPSIVWHPDSEDHLTQHKEQPSCKAGPHRISPVPFLPTECTQFNTVTLDPVSKKRARDDRSIARMVRSRKSTDLSLLLEKWPFSVE